MHDQRNITATFPIIVFPAISLSNNEDCIGSLNSPQQKDHPLQLLYIGDCYPSLFLLAHHAPFVYGSTTSRRSRFTFQHSDNTFRLNLATRVVSSTKHTVPSTPHTQKVKENLIMPCKESILNAKASFVGAVSEGIETLVEQCGYSRDRATSALMRELSRGDSTRPSDREVS